MVSSFLCGIVTSRLLSCGDWVRTGCSSHMPRPASGSQDALAFGDRPSRIGNAFANMLDLVCMDSISFRGITSALQKTGA